MVVQNGSDTLFFGTAMPGEKVQVVVKGRRFQARPSNADAQGRWSRAISFGSPSSDPIEIEFRLGTAKEPVQTLRNVLVGEVWVASIALGQGISATNHANPNLRFIALDNIEPGKKGHAGWHIADADGLRHAYFDLLAFQFAAEISAAKKIPVGVIHLPTELLAASLREALASAPTDLAQILFNAHRFVQEETRTAILNRGRILRANKRNGKVTDTPRINLYGKYRIYAPGSFRTKSELDSNYAIKGAVGPELPFE